MEWERGDGGVPRVDDIVKNVERRLGSVKENEDVGGSAEAEEVHDAEKAEVFLQLQLVAARVVREKVLARAPVQAAARGERQVKRRDHQGLLDSLHRAEEENRQNHCHWRGDGHSEV